MNDENQRLRGMLTQVSSSYQALQMHLVALMQARAGGHAQLMPHVAQALPATDGAAAVMAPLPRQFLGLGPAAAAEETSNSSTEVGSPRRSSSTGGNRRPDQQAAERGDSAPDSSARQQQQLAQEASMRKARVSVRARSEAPIVSRLSVCLMDFFFSPFPFLCFFLMWFP